jgi:hypothetical protein
VYAKKKWTLLRVEWIDEVLTPLLEDMNRRYLNTKRAVWTQLNQAVEFTECGLRIAIALICLSQTRNAAAVQPYNLTADADEDTEAASSSHTPWKKAKRSA